MSHYTDEDWKILNELNYYQQKEDIAIAKNSVFLDHKESHQENLLYVCECGLNKYYPIAMRVKELKLRCLCGNANFSKKTRTDKFQLLENKVSCVFDKESKLYILKSSKIMVKLHADNKQVAITDSKETVTTSYLKIYYSFKEKVTKIEKVNKDGQPLKSKNLSTLELLEVLKAYQLNLPANKRLYIEDKDYKTIKGEFLEQSTYMQLFTLPATVFNITKELLNESAVLFENKKMPFLKNSNIDWKDLFLNKDVLKKLKSTRIKDENIIFYKIKNKDYIEKTIEFFDYMTTNIVDKFDIKLYNSAFSGFLDFYPIYHLKFKESFCLSFERYLHLYYFHQNTSILEFNKQLEKNIDLICKPNYLNYIQLCERHDLKWRKYPLYDEKYYDNKIKEVELIIKCRDQDALNKKLKESYRNYTFPTVNSFEAIDLQNYKEKYVLLKPNSVYEIIKEGNNLNHSVAGYVDKITNSENKIFFLRLANAPTISFGTIEIVKHRIVQAKGKFNTDLNKETLEWLEDYAKENNYDLALQNK